jgi:dephospho-CoA kinase
MSGTGKSTLLGELARRGHHVLDTDDPGWIVQLDLAGGPEPGWDLDRVAAVVEGHQLGWLFIAGCVANQATLYDRFDAVVLLSAPVDVLLSRVASRVNPFGSTSSDRAKIVEDRAVVEPLLRAAADYELVTTAPVTVVARALERIAAGEVQ